MFERREGRGRGQGYGYGHGQGDGYSHGQGHGRGRGMGLGKRSDRGLDRGIHRQYQQEPQETAPQEKMKIAVITNNEKTVAKHIGLAKKIAIYQFPEGILIKTVENPIMKRIKEEGIKLDKHSEGNRHLDVGHIIPAFLKQHGIDAFVTRRFGKAVKDNLLAIGITPVIPQSHIIAEIIEEIKRNQEQHIS